MKHLVVGLGEVGTAIRSILQCDGWDLRDATEGKPLLPLADVLHICFPYSKSFVFEVKSYIHQTGASSVIVHSSVPLHTCDPEGWVHSPVRGVHPYLELGIRTFVKYFGGVKAYEAAEPFRALGILCAAVNKASSTEALKLWDTTQYGLMIMIQKEMHQWCEQNDVPFDLIYTDANHTYSIGYESLNRPEVARPYLKFMPGPIGGHCVIPNAHLLDTPMSKQLIEFNETLKNTQD